MYTSVQGAVNNAWTVFRDISNILIIGFFTFIAISTILGITEYGAKKLLSRVLIVAVLINFSLLFTKLVIDASNFTAYQFYSASISNVDNPGNATAKDQITSSNGKATAQIAGNGIAGTFIQYLGVTGFADSYNAVRNAQEANDDASIGLVIGVLSFIFLIATALVFLYGSFILITRAILFIFLLITSSLAFATYLIPKLADNYGWSKWWDALFKNAILAPILMMMLWATLAVAGGISKSLAIPGPDGTRGTIGALAQNPTSAANISALLSFVIILGLLFASFKLASKFSSGVGGFNFAAMVPALGLAMGARAVAFGGRQTIGRGSLAASDAFKKRAQNSVDGSLVQSLYKFGSNRFKGVATSDMNAMRSPLGASVAKSTGLSLDALAGKALKGYEGSLKERAKNFAHDAEQLHVDTKKQAEITKDAVRDELAKNPALAERHATVSTIISTNTNEKAAAEKLRDNAREEALKAGAEASAATTSDARSAAQAKLANHQNILREQEARIKRATDTLKNSTAALKNIEEEAKTNALASGSLKTYKNEAELAATLAHSRFTNILTRAAGISTIENDRLAQLSRKEVGEHHEKKEAKKIADYLKEKAGDHGDDHAPKTAAQPVAATSGHADTPPAASHDDHGTSTH